MTLTNAITSSNPLLQDATLTGAERTSAAAQASSSTASAQINPTATTVTDGASLSGAGSLLAAASTTDDVRTDKVAALQAAINDGTYNVSASDVADKLMKTLLG